MLKQPARSSRVTAITSILAASIETLRTGVRTSGAVSAERVPATAGDPTTSVRARHFLVDGDYLVKGVAGRILWSLLQQYLDEGRTEFTNREVRLDPTLDVPDFHDNFESRLIMLKRRLDERVVPIQIEKTGRGRFRLLVEATPSLEPRGER